MFRLWGRIWKDNHMLKDTVICDDRQETRTHKVFHCLEQICYELDLGNPIWLDTTVRDFKKHSKTRFYQDNFIEQIDFDYLEIQEENDEKDKNVYAGSHQRSTCPYSGNCKRS